MSHQPSSAPAPVKGESDVPDDQERRGMRQAFAGAKLLAAEFFTRRRQVRGGLYLPLVRVEGRE